MNLLVCELSQSIGSRRVLLRCLPYFQELCKNLTIISNDASRLKKDCEDSDLEHFDILSPVQVAELCKKTKSSSFFKKLRRRFLPKEAQYASFLEDVILSCVKNRGISAIWYPWIVDHPIPKAPVKSGGMVMDMAWRAYSDGFTDPDEIERKFIKNARKLDLLFPISNFTHANIGGAFPELKSRLFTVHHATDGKKPDKNLTKQAGSPDSNFILYPASLTENKNHTVLFEAFAEALIEAEDLTLVLTGGNTPKLTSSEPLSGHQEKLRQIYRKLPDKVRKKIHIAGHVKDTELSWYYRHSLAVVLPTYYEGFGLPLIEALENSAYVIASDIPPFREQVELYKAAESVSFFDHRKPPELSLLILKSLRKKKVESTYDASSWTWKNAAESYLMKLS